MPVPMGPIRLLLVDDHEVVRVGLDRLTQQPGHYCRRRGRIQSWRGAGGQATQTGHRPDGCPTAGWFWC